MENNQHAEAHGAQSDGGTMEKIALVFVTIEKTLLAACLCGMVILVLVQIIMRNVWDSGLEGGDSIVKHLVLWVAFLGAGLATREKSHIRIDVATKIIPDKWKPLIEILVDLFSIGVTAMLIFASYSFVTLEYEGQATLPFLNIPVWVMEMIIPVGLVIIMLRFLFQTIGNFNKMMKG